MGYYFIRTLLWMGVLASLSSALRAQDSSKTTLLVIEVKDQSGGLVQNAQVQILPLPNPIAKNLETGSDGRLYIDVPPGRYDLSVKSPLSVPLTKRIEVQSATRQLIAIVLESRPCPPASCDIVVGHPGPISLGPYVFPVSFPDQSKAVSPDGRYVILGVDSDTDPHHTVFLEDRVLKTRRKVFNYNRRVAFLWYYDSKAFAATDFVDADSSRCDIFSVDEKVPPIPVLDLLFRQLSDDARETLKSHVSNHHVYVEALVWTEPMDLQLKVSAYGDIDPEGFTEFYNLHVYTGQP